MELVEKLQGVVISGLKLAKSVFLLLFLLDSSHCWDG